jgi:two-component system, cell cycle sensor histidine kinase and response regulator CckA
MTRPGGIGGEDYRSLFENMLNGLAYCRMIWEDGAPGEHSELGEHSEPGEPGEPGDWVYLDVNKAFTTLTGLHDVIGKRASEVLPGIRVSDPALFRICGRVASTGVPEQFEMYVEALSMWLLVSAYSPRKDHFVTIFEVVTHRKAGEEALRQSEQRFRATFEQAPVGIALTAPDGRWLLVNPKMCAMLGYTEEELVGGNFVHVTFADDVERQAALVSQLRAGTIDSFVLDKRYVRKDGGIVWARLTASLVRRPTGEPDYSIAIVEDVTAVKRSELEKESLRAQLMQAQKMESIGRLAGGVAHDFNNVLQIITGCAEMAQADAEGIPALRQSIEQIRSAAGRAADLTRQLLAFARRQAAAPRVIDLNDAVAGTLKLLSRLLGEDIELVWRPGHGVGNVRIDPAQVDQVLANLCVNARDAIGGPGRITIQTRRVVLEERDIAAHPGSAPGEYAALLVTDDGHGMDTATMEHLFEPYFTTKAVGKGTGLGLSTVYGIVTQNGGFLDVSSEPRRGTTFTVHLPRVQTEAAGTVSPAAPSPRGRGELILLVEDDPAILRVAKTILESLGYRAVTASTPETAIALAEGNGERIELLVTDVVMPQMDGRALAERLSRIVPGLKVLFVSGYTADIVAETGLVDDGIRLLQKPFSASQLAAAVDKALRAGSRPAAS